jgi:hypothetical protein
MGRDILASAKQIVSRSRGGRERSEGGATEHQLTQKVDQLQEQLIAIQKSLDALLKQQPLLPGSGKVISAVPPKRFAN